MKWEAVAGESSEYLAVFRDPEGWYEARVKSDGCLEFFRYFNYPHPHREHRRSDDVHQIHICDLGDYLLRLRELQSMAEMHFGEGWPR